MKWIPQGFISWLIYKSELLQERNGKAGLADRRQSEEERKLQWSLGKVKNSSTSKPGQAGFTPHNSSHGVCPQNQMAKQVLW